MGVSADLKKKAKQALRNLSGSSRFEAEKRACLTGAIAAQNVRTMECIDTLADVEFSVSSQWGEDGIIEWIVHNNGPMPETFVEFGVENYTESNTRFLLQNRNWRGLVIDGSEEHIRFIRSDYVSWRHDLTAVASFITRDNINQLISGVGFTGETGILSVDIDGNDYWVWKAIDVISPHIVIAEYNAVFGDLLPLTVPYRPDFMRTPAHYSNLYWGASVAALESLAKQRGYVMLGTNRAGSNVFFVRQDRFSAFENKIGRRISRPSRFREARAKDGSLSLVRGMDRTHAIADCEVENVATGEKAKLASLSPLYSEAWLRMLDASAP